MELLLFLLLNFSYAASDRSSYRIYLADTHSREKTFVIDVTPVMNPKGHRMLESYIKQGVRLDQNGNPQIGVVIGNIWKTKPTERHAFNFRFDPRSVRWNDLAMEACDGILNDVETNLEIWLQKKRFCPWTTPSLVVKIVKDNKVIWRRPTSEAEVGLEVELSSSH